LSRNERKNSERKKKERRKAALQVLVFENSEIIWINIITTSKIGEGVYVNVNLHNCSI
jgi:ABC-type siderophore export system fused ATPase/permease subunit